MSSTSIRLANESDEQRWNEFALSSPLSSFFQTWEWGRVQEAFGAKIWRLIVEEADDLRATACVVRRDLPLGKSWLYVQRGPVVRDGEDGIRVWQLLEEKLRELAKVEKAMFVRVDPAFAKASTSAEASVDKSAGAVSFSEIVRHGNWRKGDREVQPKHTLLLDLTTSEEVLLAGMKQKTRYNIGLAQKKGVTVRFSSSVEDLEIFLGLARQVHGRSGFHFHPERYYRAIMDALAPAKMAELAIAEHDGQALAVHLMIYAGSVATYAHGASSSEKRELMAPAYLYWETIRRAKQMGCNRYDFFGVAPADAPAEHPWAGITRIKEGFGGKRVEYVGAYDLVLEPALYQLFNAARKVKNLLS